MYAIIKHRFSPGRMWISCFLIFLGIIGILFIWGKNLLQPNEEKYFFLVDNSLSMVVQDISEEQGSGFLSRFSSAKKFLSEAIKKSSFSVGLATFSRQMTLELPFTSDKNFAETVLESLSPRIYGGGSDLITSLKTFAEIYKTTPNIVLTIITDGEFFDENLSKIDFPPNIRIIFVGIGTEKGGYMIQGYGTDGRPRYREFQGQKAISSLDVKQISRISDFFDAKYFLLRKEGEISSMVEQIFGNNQQQKSFFGWEIFAYISLFIGIIFMVYPYEKV